MGNNKKKPIFPRDFPLAIFSNEIKALLRRIFLDFKVLLFIRVSRWSKKHVEGGVSHKKIMIPYYIYFFLES